MAKKLELMCSTFLKWDDLYLLYEQEIKCSASYTLRRNKTELKISPNADKFKIELTADKYSWANELMISDWLGHIPKY